MEKFDLKEQEGRKNALIALHKSIAEALVKLGADYNYSIRVNETSVEISLSKGTDKYYESHFASDVTFYPKLESTLFGRQNAEVSYGTTGAFDPTNIASVFRTKFAAFVIDNWNEVNEICTNAISYYKELKEEIKIINNL